jgi:hypothetical protein
MIDRTNIQHLPLNRPGQGIQYPAGKKDQAAVPASGGSGLAAGNTDMVQISTDAALRGKISAYAATLGKDLSSIRPELLAMLREKYKGEACPVSGIDVAKAILAKIHTELGGSGDE